MEHDKSSTSTPATITSVEDQIAFVWVDLAELIDVDLRPQSMKAWLMSGGGVEPDSGPLLSAFPADLKYNPSNA
jgi:hypothetical protein